MSISNSTQQYRSKNVRTCRLGRWMSRSTMAGCALMAMLSPALFGAPDLATYRAFRIGTDLATVVRATQGESSQVKVLHERPAVIQEIEWRPAYSGPGSDTQAVRAVALTFYNGQLSRMFIDYKQDKTDGLGVDDMIESISTMYGLATRPVATITTGSLAYAYRDSESILARWQDSEYSVSLIRSSYAPAFALIVVSKQLDALRERAAVEAARLDVLEAPQIERARAKNDADKERARQEKAKLVNKPGFRP